MDQLYKIMNHAIKNPKILNSLKENIRSFNSVDTEASHYIKLYHRAHNNTGNHNHNSLTGTSRSLVSIIMPTYNSQSFIAKTIQSILEQDYPNLELIIIDDASIDKTLESINSIRDLRVRVYRNNKNLGIPLSRNRGLKLARGQYITFFDHDDIMLQGAIRRRVAFFKQYRRANIVSGFTKGIVNSQGRYLKKHPFQNHFKAQNKGIAYLKKHRKIDFTSFKKLPGLKFAFLSNLLIRKDLIKKVGLFDRQFIYADDSDYLFRLMRESPLYFHDIPIKNYHFHRGNRSMRITSQERKAEYAKLFIRYLCKQSMAS